MCRKWLFNGHVHRVIDGFMIQGGGLNPAWKKKMVALPQLHEQTMACLMIRAPLYG